MPFKSKAQARFMFAKHPAIAKEFAAKTSSIKSLPDYVNPKHSHPYSMNPSANSKGGCMICGRPYSEHEINMPGGGRASRESAGPKGH